MNIHMEQYHGDGDYWAARFISIGFEFTEDDLTAVRCEVELAGGRPESLRPLDQYHRPGGGPARSYRGGWDRADGRHRTNRIVVSCTKGLRPGPTEMAYRVLRERYPSARFTMHDRFLREELNARGLDIVTP